MSRVSRAFASVIKTAKGRSPFVSAAVVLGALFMAWPAFYSGFPLMYPDTPSYLSAGRPVAAAILLHHRSFFYGGRSLIYSLGILPFHWGVTVWPIIALQCLLTSFVLWLVFRSISPRKTWINFLILMLLLSLLTTLSWNGAFVMPDILGPDLYLCVFLLVFARDTLSRAERWALYLISWWAIVSHATHLMIVIALCCSLALLALFRPMTFRKHLRIAGELTAIIALAVGAQIALNTFLYGKPSLNGTHPPFLTARLIADGPGLWYLEKNCAELKWEMCNYVNNLSGSANRFLWNADGVWVSATSDSRKRILRDEMPFTMAVLRTYPREQLHQSAANFLKQLITFDLKGFGPASDIYTLLQFLEVLPKSRLRYLESRQARNQLPLRLFNSIQHGVVIASLIGIATLLPWLWSCRPPRLVGLSLVIACSVIANSLFAGTLSMVTGRFECRVIWLIPLFAGLCFFKWQATRKGSKAEAIPDVTVPSMSGNFRLRSIGAGRGN